VSQIDRPLLEASVARWERCFANGNESTEDRRLFRALEMARAASKTPGGADASEHDAGRVSALWVSAFEILAHDGHRSDFRRVLSLLNDVKWLSQKLEIKDRTVGKDKQISTNLAGAVYDRLYTARNHFLHGNPVTAQTLMLEKCRKHVHLFAPYCSGSRSPHSSICVFRRRCQTRRTIKIEGDISRNRQRSSGLSASQKTQSSWPTKSRTRDRQPEQRDDQALSVSFASRKITSL
jgi:hypothetical protein